MLLKMVDLLYYLHFSRSSIPGRVDFVTTSSCFFPPLLLTKFLEELKSLKHFIAEKDYITDREKTKVFKTIATWNGEYNKSQRKSEERKSFCA